jgi:trehalose synthase-fused probable maltokinase
VNAHSLPTLSTRGPLRTALADATLATLTTDALATFLLGRRWFGGKGRAPQSARVRDAVPLFDGASTVARIDVDAGAESASTYQLPLAVRSGEPPAGDRAPRAILARVESADGPGFVFDALEDEGFRRELGVALAGGARFRGASASWVIEPIASEPVGDEQSRVASAEQSNTSVLYDDRAILKIYRRLSPGENPDVEIAEFLERRTLFSHVPRLLGTIRFHDADGSQTVAGMEQRLVPNRGDGWAFALESVRREVGGDRRSHVLRPFAKSARRLGVITRELHEALASDPRDPSFAPLPVSEGDLENWCGRIAVQVKRSGELLAEHASRGDLTPAARALARECLAHLPEVPARIRGLAASLRDDAGSRIRHHGDYHLGQLLVTTDDDFVVLDFEGEPARPLAERRERHSPMRDVAGMLRSFSYATAVGGRELAGRSEAGANLRRWEDEARSAFLAEYFGERLPSFVPQAPGAADRLLALFETEKVFYELAYELNNRPDWVEVPLAGIARLVAP